MKNINLPLSFKSNKYYFLVSIEEEKYIKAVYDDIVVRRCDMNNLHCEYISFESGTEFNSILSKIENDTIEEGTYPHIHIETHGCEGGIQLSNKFILDWDLLSNQLQKVNGACGNNLVITMAACWGGVFYHSLGKKLVLLMEEFLNGKDDTEIRHRAPFLIVIGPYYESDFGELEEGFSDLFDVFLGSGELNEGVCAFKTKQRLAGIFKGWSCQATFYEYVQKNIIDRDFNDHDKFKNSLNLIVKTRPDVMKKSESLTEKGSLKMNKTLWRKLFNDLQEFRKTYFWIDKFPENESRFVKLDMPEEYPF